MRHGATWLRNKLAARTNNTLPTMTDQAAAKETDINVIVKNFTVHGQVPKGNAQPMYADFTALPADLRGFIDMGRGLKQHAAQLPAALKTIPLEQLIGMSNEQIGALLAPKPTTTTTEQKQ